MVRRRRLLAGAAAHYVIRRGNDRKPIFFTDDGRLLYPNWLSTATMRHGALLHAYVPMTNHVHLLVTTERELTLPRILQSLGRRYVAHINATYRRTGTLWEGRYRSTVLDRAGYILACHRYIEANPLRARMVGEPDPLLAEHPVYRSLGATAEQRRTAYRILFDQGLGEDILRAVRDAPRAKASARMHTKDSLAR